MTWTYFTSYLTGGRAITKEERNELLDNLQTLLAMSGCSSAGYSLNAGELTTAKANHLKHDRARLDGPSSSVTRARLQTLFATASAAFTNYSAAVTTALSGEGITSTERDTIISSALDHHKLWNYYKRLLDALACPCTVDEADEGLFADLPYGQDFDVTGQFTAAQDVDLTFVVDSNGTGMRLVLKANGVSIHDTGCVLLATVTPTVTVPAGTTTLRVEVTACSGTTAGEFLFELACP
jgi:hypothetical protein